MKDLRDAEWYAVNPLLVARVDDEIFIGQGTPTSCNGRWVNLQTAEDLILALSRAVERQEVS